MCRTCLNPGGQLVVPCCCAGGIHQACLEKEKLSSRHPGFCDTCGELFSDEPPVLVAENSATSPQPGASNAPRRALAAVAAAAGLLAAGGAVACLAAASGRTSKTSEHSTKPKRSLLEPLRAFAQAAAAKQAAQGKGKPAEQNGGRAAGRRGRGPAPSKGCSTGERLLLTEIYE